MENEYKVFPEKFNRVLDLVELVDEGLAENYKKSIKSLPDCVHESLATCGEFALFGKDFDSDLTIDGDILELEHFQFNKYLQKSIKIYPFYEDELDEDFEQLFLFSLTLSNIKTTPKLKINYTIEDGNLKYVNTEMNGIEIFYSVMLDKREDDYCLTCKKELNGHELYVKQKIMSYDELVDYAAEDDSFFEDDECCYDDFEDGLSDD